MSQNPAFAYRPDIDGLRAIAVLSVVFYHFGIGGLSGGFVGVDVFYVISGFLITGIIQREIEQGRFTFSGFYERRIRRIFPALFVVLAATLAVGTAILLPTDLILLGKSTIATLLFSSNILFWRTNGYFDGNSELNPLLHTWSLAVEEQFYIGLPIMLLLVYRYARGLLKLVLIVSTILSFAACSWVQELRPTAAFYLSPFRAWELLLGSYLAVGNLPQITKSWLREMLASVGLVLLVLSIIFIKAGPEFPGWQALGPVLGTGLLIYAGGSGRTKISSWLSVKPMVFIGLISYSLYLWHWPVVVFSKYLNALEPIGSWAYAGVLVSVGIAACSYTFIETPFREHKDIFTRRRLFSIAIFGTVILGAISFLFLTAKGIPSRFSSEVVALDAERNPDIPLRKCDAIGIVNEQINNDCILGDKSISPSIIIWGDSHALAWSPAFDEMLQENGLSAVLAFNSVCAPLENVIVDSDYLCQSQNKVVRKHIKNSNSIKSVILAARWSSYSENDGFYQIRSAEGIQGNETVFPSALISTLISLKNDNKSIWIIGQVPVAPGDAPTRLAIAKAHGLRIPTGTPSMDARRVSNSFYGIANKINGIYISNPEQWLCKSLACIYQVDGKSIYRNGNHDHLNTRGAIYLKHDIKNDYERFISLNKGLDP